MVFHARILQLIFSADHYIVDIYALLMFWFSYFSPAVAKDEPPDTWDDEEQEKEEEKEKLRGKDKDLEFLFQEVLRDSSLDDYLKRDLQSKKSDPKYKEMLVNILISIKLCIQYIAIRVK